MPLNIEPATKRMAELVRQVPDDALGTPTPCGIPLGALLDHIGTLALAFTGAGRKSEGGLTGPPPRPDASNLASDWRESIPGALEQLADAWNEPEAWTGMTKVGGMDMPGEAAGVVALDEVVMHSWDVARATDQPYDVDPDLLEALMDFLSEMASPGMADAREGLFGPVVPVPDEAPLLDRALGLAGRDPKWSAS
jgi:uncharacterized protein (TIGR03086 family)